MIRRASSSQLGRAPLGRAGVLLVRTYPELDGRFVAE